MGIWQGPVSYTHLVTGVCELPAGTEMCMPGDNVEMTVELIHNVAMEDVYKRQKVDPLIGLKENVIIGKLIPAGTGMKRYQNVELDSNEDVYKRQAHYCRRYYCFY